jgi:hypothetical protein
MFMRLFICLFILFLYLLFVYCMWARTAHPSQARARGHNLQRSGAENYPRNLRRRPRYRISCVGVNVCLFILFYFIVYCVVVCLCGCGRTSGPRTTPAICISVPDIAYRHGAFVSSFVLFYFLLFILLFNG